MTGAASPVTTGIVGASGLDSTPETLGAMVPAAAGAFVVAVLIGLVVRRAGRTRPVVRDLSRRGRRPLRLSFVIGALRGVVEASTVRADWVSPVAHALTILLIAGVGWLVVAFAFVVEDLLLARYRVDVADNRHARRVRTQVMVVRRLAVAAIAVVTLGLMLITFPQARTFGTSLLASAGVVGIVAGLAAQTALANVFAGVQLAFTDALRVDDVVVVQGQWGRIEEITMTYVVVHIWDDRRLILPSTWFTSQPFENWTRTTAAVLGAVELDLDWSVPVEELRRRMHAVLEGTDLWDGRVAVLQVTDAVNSFVRVRALVSGVDGPTVFDLRCHVREELVTWLRREHPDALPRVRTQAQDPDAEPATRPPGGGRPGAGRIGGSPARDDRSDSDARLFTGSIEAVARSKAFTGGDERPRD